VGSKDALNKILDLTAFKNPDLRVLEVDFDRVQSRSIWVDGSNSESFDRTTCGFLAFGAQRGYGNLRASSEPHITTDFRSDQNRLLSLCGIVGQKGQSNYTAANAFLASFALYRKSLGLAAYSVDLGLIEDVGYVNGKESLSKRLFSQGWRPISERLLSNILYFSILQQTNPPLNPSSSAHLISGMPVPVPQQSPAQRDPRFSGLRYASGSGAHQGSPRSGDAQSAVNILREAWRAYDGDGDQSELLCALTALANKQFMKSLGMAEEMDPTRPITSYGIDSLVAVEFKNWASVDLGVEIATLDVVGAKTPTSLCQVILNRGCQSRGQK
jgi:hypothetical protein